MALIGYARVSTADQTAALQVDALVAAGCEKIFTDKASGAKVDRPELTAALDYARDGDVIAVWRLDRLGRSLRHLIDVVADLEARGVGFRSITESLDTTSPAGKLVFHIFGSLAEFERSLIAERTGAGLAAARARGRLGGRKPSLSPQKIKVAQRMYDDGDASVNEIADTLGVSRATIYRYVQRNSA